MEKILNTPIPYKINGLDLKISGYSLCDLSDMRQWLKNRKLELLKGLDKEDRLI